MFMIRLQVQQNRTGVTRAPSLIEASSGLEPERYRSVIGQGHLHIGGELTGFDDLELRVAQGDQFIEVGRGFLGVCALCEARTGTLSCVSRQRELRHQQQTAGYILDAKVHAAFSIGKYPVRQYPLGETLDVAFFIIAMDCDEHEQTAVNLADDLFADRDAGFSDALQEPYHFFA
jgi:hypothetical protein